MPDHSHAENCNVNRIRSNEPPLARLCNCSHLARAVRTVFLNYTAMVNAFGKAYAHAWAKAWIADAKGMDARDTRR